MTYLIIPVVYSTFGSTTCPSFTTLRMSKTARAMAYAINTSASARCMPVRRYSQLMRIAGAAGTKTYRDISCATRDYWRHQPAETIMACPKNLPSSKSKAAVPGIWRRCLPKKTARIEVVWVGTVRFGIVQEFPGSDTENASPTVMQGYLRAYQTFAITVAPFGMR
jgi:hypothetical protein